MAIMLTAEQMRHTKATNAYVIKNPEQITNKFTITEESVAADTLNLGETKKIADLKEYLKGFDMTAISSDDLRKVARRLFDNEMIDIHAFVIFAEGNLASGADGLPTETDVKFNAIALFNERLEDYNDFLENNPADVKEDTLRWRRGMIDANHAIGALTYFVNSSSSDLKIHEQA